MSLPLPFTLKELHLPLIDTQTCKAYYQEGSSSSSQGAIIRDDMLCASLEEGQKDACGVIPEAPWSVTLVSGLRPQWQAGGLAAASPRNLVFTATSALHHVDYHHNLELSPS
ncbi:serine protease 30-like [Elephas maximus indicus]|uniref:serine protease 30-like n=1 Tax=Elephas maximus indicus TaxID=99487 RepID=UPI00211633A0|nr:serine protease 30-like [Elephas maximus indicus]